MHTINSLYPKHPEIYDICMKNAEKSKFLHTKTYWIHLSDAVESGSISPMEFYDSLKSNYKSETLMIRKSRYKSLIERL